MFMVESRKMSDPGVQASIHKDVNTTLPRVYNYYTATRFRQVNLIDRLYPDTRSVELSHWAVPGGEGAWQEWSFEDVVQQNFEPTSLGEQFGPTWSTHWFKVNFQVPDEWAGSEVRLRWGSNSEAAVWSPDGSILQGLSTGDTGSLRTDFTITNSYEAGSPPYTLYIEMAANRLLGASPGDLIDPPDPEMRFTLSRAEISQLDSRIYKLTRDLEVLYQLAEQLMPDQRGYQALYTANQMVNSITAGDDSVASDLADQYLAKGNGERAHTLAAIGNCHIDSAWLWPYSETKRKVARSFSSQLKLMEDYPEHIFVASQHVGLTRFLTQKLSWNTVNKFPHHSFLWEGIDGTTVLAHFPPGDSYSMSVTVTEALHTVNNLQDKGRAGTSAFLFGYGDGGGGPTQDMLERARRLKDTDGCPRMQMMNPDELFGRLEKDQHNLCRWVGELFLERHNGTYTTQADMKRLCRETEFKLRDAEFLLSQAVAVLGPAAASSLLQQSLLTLDGAWKKTMLNQFHDVLPGSGIAIIYPEATRLYQEAMTAAQDVFHNAANAIF
ncbi:hypothetical protein OTU49_005982, partial [Cherax quadricarinatus]